MKKIFTIVLVLIFAGCKSVSKTLNSSVITTSTYLEIVPFNYEYNLAIIPVSIAGKTYNFLVDTGAPTLISSAIYATLPKSKPLIVNVKDSQGQSKAQKITTVPEITIGNLSYKNVGAVVADLRDVFEFNCMQIDGIIGANQMAKSFWKFDYQNKEITITDRLANYDLSEYAATVPFSVSRQKTPYVYMHVNGIRTLFTYDTGAAGFIDFHDKTDALKDKTGFTRYGNSDIGLFGAVDSVMTRTVRADSLQIGNITLRDALIDVENDNLLGNRFMNHYDIVMDWEKQHIYLKEIKERKRDTLQTFGFNYRIKNNKAVVSRLIKEFSTDFKMGDIILSINDYNFSDLTNENACERYLSVKLKDLDTLNVYYARDDKEYRTTVVKKVLID